MEILLLSGKHFGLPDGTSLWNHMMEKAAEYEAKENELGELREKENKAQQQIQILEEEKANLIDKNKTETTKVNSKIILILFNFHA